LRSGLAHIQRASLHANESNGSDSEQLYGIATLTLEGETQSKFLSPPETRQFSVLRWRFPLKFSLRRKRRDVEDTGVLKEFFDSYEREFLATAEAR